MEWRPQPPRSHRSRQGSVKTLAGELVSAPCTHADRPLRRMRGLLGRSGLGPGEGVLLTPASSIHTAFMRFPIDAVFLDRDLRVVRVAEGLPPFRLASARGARHVLELAAGEARRAGVRTGQLLVWEASPSEERQATSPRRRSMPVATFAGRGGTSTGVRKTQADGTHRGVHVDNGGGSMFDRFSLLVCQALALGNGDLTREDGQTTVEYGLVLAFVAILLAGVLVALSTGIGNFIDFVVTKLQALPGF